MATNTRAHPQRSVPTGESSSSATAGNPERETNINVTITPQEPGHISELDDNEEESSAGSSSEDEEIASVDAERTLDAQIANATRTRDALAKKHRLQELTEEIQAFERGEKRTATASWESAGPAKVQRNLRPKDLKIFHAKSTREHRNWVRDAEEQFRLTPQNFITDEDKILWCNQFLGDDPKEQYHNEKAKDLNEVSTWATYVSFLLNLIEDPVNRELDLAQAYADASQRPSQSVREFDAYLNSLEAQMLPYSEEQRTSHFFTKLRPEIRAAVTDVQTVPTKRNELVSLATRLENNRRRRNPDKGKGNHSSSQGNHKSGKSGGSGSHTNTNQPDAGQATASRNKNQKGSKSKRQRDPKSTEEFLKTIQCHKCKQMGHYANKCPNPGVDDANSVPVGSVGNIEGRAVPAQGKGNPSSETPRRRGQ